MTERSRGKGRFAGMKRFLVAPLALFVVSPVVAQNGATGIDTVRCSLNSAPDKTCRMKDSASRDGSHTMVFAVGAQRLTFVGRHQNGWWAGKLNGKPAMGYERNRGNVVLSTYDLSTNFAWWYPTNAHGSY